MTSVARTLFNHHCVDAYPGLNTVVGMEYYAGRILAASSPGDVVQVHPHVVSEVPAIVEHYRNAGFAVATEIVADLSAEVAHDFPDADYSVYLFGSEQHRVRPNARRFAATARFDEKNDFIEWCQGHAYPVPDTQVNGSDLTSQALPFFVKASHSGFGLHVFECTDTAAAEHAIRQIAGPYQLQEKLSNCTFVNVQYRGSEHLATTDQVLDGFSYVGSRYPCAFDPRSVTDPIAIEIVRAGLEDVFAFDVAALPGTDGTEFLLVETNPRYNAATYATLTAQRIGADRWSTVPVSTRYRDVESVLDCLGDALYDPVCKTGILLVNWGAVRSGKLLVLVVGTPDDEISLRERLTALH